LIKKEDIEQRNTNLNSSIDLKEVFKTVMRYKFMIVFLTVVFTSAAAVFAYFKPNIYMSSITFELNDNKSNSQNNMLMQAIDGQSANLDNETEILKSRFLAYKAFDFLDLNTRYYLHKTKTQELYKDSPFVVNKEYIEDFLYGRNFVLTPVDENTFNLKIEKIVNYKSIDGLLKLVGLRPYTNIELYEYDLNHNYGEKISNEYFSLQVNKLQKFSTGKYSFKFLTDLSNYYMFRGNISVSKTSRASTILKINYTDVSPQRAKDILNALVKAYMDEEVAQKTKEANLTLDFIDSQIEAINQRLKVSESRLENFKEKNKVIGLSEQAAMITGKLSEYEAKLEELQTELNILENLNRFINTNEDVTGLSIGGIGFADPALAGLITKLQEEVALKSSLLVNYTNIHPDVVKAGQNIATLKRSIKATLGSNLNQLRQRKALIKENIKKYNRSVASVPKQESELSRLTRFYNIDEKVYSYLLEKKAETAILKSSTISKSRVLDEAIANNSPIKPKRIMIVLVGFILGLIAGLAYAFLREFLNNTVKNSDDVERLSNIPIYGIIPNRKNKKSEKLLDEAFRAMRTNLQFLPKHEKSDIIAITSSVSGE